jgi:hypothetical protein
LTDIRHGPSIEASSSAQRMRSSRPDVLDLALDGQALVSAVQSSPKSGPRLQAPLRFACPAPGGINPVLQPGLDSRGRL